MSNSPANILSKSILLLWLTALTVLARPMAPSSDSNVSSLVARLKLDEASPGLDPASPNCLDSLFQLQACTGEIVLFFLNGETYLGDGCCSAIRVIQKDCWPSMLGSLGVTAEEGDVLQGYCDAASTTDASQAP